MHEMGIAMEIVDIAKASIPADMQGSKVRKVNLQVGKLSAIVADSLRFCFDIAAKDTPLSGARLVIDTVPVVARCRACRHEWTISGPAFSCEACGSGDLDLLSGRELDIQSIEIMDDDTADPVPG